MKNARGNVKLLVLSAFIVQPVYGLLWSVYGPFLRLQEFSGTLYGVVASAGVFSSIAGSLIAGVVADKRGAKKVLAASVILSSAGLVVLSHGGFYWVLAASIMVGAAMGAGYVALIAILSKSVPDSEMDKGFSYVSAASSIGAGIGSFLGWLPELVASSIGHYEAYRLTLLYGGLLLPALELPIVYLLVEPRPQLSQPRRAPGEKGLPRSLVKTFAKLSLIEFIIGFGAALSVQNIDYYFVLKYGVKSGELGTVFGVEQVAMGLLMLAMPRASRAAGGPLRAYILITSPSIPLLVAMTLVDNYALAASMFIARTILMNVAGPLYQAFQMQLLPPEYRGRGSAILGLAWQVPVGIGRGVGGYLLDVDLELPLRLTAMLYAAALGLLAVLFPEHVRPRRALRANSSPTP